MRVGCKVFIRFTHALQMRPRQKDTVYTAWRFSAPGAGARRRGACKQHFLCIFKGAHPPRSLTPISGPTTKRIRRTSRGRVAPAVENPVDVFTKSACADSESRQAATFSSSVSPGRLDDDLHQGHARVSCLHHRANIVQHLVISFGFRTPTWITMSISLAPCSMAVWVSNTFAAVVVAPNGKPTTVHTFTGEPAQGCCALGNVYRVDAHRGELGTGALRRTAGLPGRGWASAFNRV